MDGSYLIRYLFARGWAPRRQPSRSTSSGARRWATAPRSGMPSRSSRAAAGPPRSWSCRRRPGITDVLLGLATRAVAGDKSGRDGLTRRRRGAAQALPCDREGRARQRAARPAPARSVRARRRDRQLARRAREPARQPGRAEGADTAHARLRRQPRRAAVGADVRGGAGGGRDAVGVRRRDRDRVHRRTVRRRVAEPRADRRGGAQEAAAADRRGQGAGRSRFHRQRRHRGRRGARDRRARGRDAGPRRLRPDRDAARAGAGRARRVAVEGRPRPADRRSARRPRRARHPAAAPARGGRARVLRREGAAPARADPGRRPAACRCSCARSPTRPRPAPRSRRAARWTSIRSRRCRRRAGRR